MVKSGCAGNTSTYPPQEKSPKGERHEDRSFISYEPGKEFNVYSETRLRRVQP